MIITLAQGYSGGIILSMAFLRKFSVELIVVAIIVGWAVAKFPDLVTPWIPWLCLAVVWHLLSELLRRGVAARWLRRKRRAMVYLIAFLVGGAVSVAIIWSIRNGVEKLAVLEVQRAHPNEATTDVQLSITCDSVGLPMRYTGDLWFLDTIMYSGLGRLSNNQKVSWPEDGVKGLGYKCTVKNYGTHTAFGISLSLDVTVFHWIQTGPASWGDGDLKGKHAETILIPKPLGPQGSDEFSFYICSYDPNSSLSVSIPAVAWINSDDPQKKREVPLRISSLTGKSIIEVPAKMLAARHPKPALVPIPPPSILIPSDPLNMSDTRASLIGDTLKTDPNKGSIRIVFIGAVRPDLEEQLKTQFGAGGWKVDSLDIGSVSMAGFKPIEALYILSPHPDGPFATSALRALSAAHITAPVHPEMPTMGPMSLGIPDVTIVVQ